MKQSPNHRPRVRIAGLVLCAGSACCFFFGQISAQNGPEATDPDTPKWTATDSRLANQYLKLLQQKPEYGNVLDLLWDLYAKKAQIPLLLDYISKAAQADAATTSVKLIHAHLLRKNEDTEGARDAYSQVLDTAPDSIPALLALAEIAEQQKRLAKSLSYYTRITAILPPRDDLGAAVRLRKADLHIAQNQTRSAVATWDELLAARAGDSAMRAEIVGLLLETGETSRSIEILEKQVAAAQDVRSRLDALAELERVYELIDDFEGALQTTRDAMKVLHFKNHRHQNFFERLVRLHERFGRLSELEKRLRSRIDQNNPSESSLYQLASFYRLTANPYREEEALRDLVDLLPKTVEYRVRLAELQLTNDRYEESAATLDELFDQEDQTVPLSLLLFRVRIDISAEDELAAQNRLVSHLEENGDSDTRERIMEFARDHYLDDLVEKILRDSAEEELTGSDGDSAPLDLARFLDERGRLSQASEVLEKYIAGAGDSKSEQARRLHQAALAYRDLERFDEAEKVIGRALALHPEEPEFLSTKAGLQVDLEDWKGAVDTLDRVWELQPDLEAKTAIDQKIFSLLRASGPTVWESDAVNDIPQGPITSPAQYRQMARALSARSSRESDEEPPKELIDYYEALRRAANSDPSLERRFRAGWWAFKLQDNHECYFQLSAAQEEAAKPVIEVEKMLLDLAEQNERPTLMARHLRTLAEIDSANEAEYMERWAVVRFELGFEDEAVRELKRLAAQPGATLSTLGALAGVYAKQGGQQKQVSVWQNAYRKANLFDKRRIVRQLTTALIEQGKPQAALQAQMDLIERENDLLQRRKQFEWQLTAASRHYLLEWLRGRYLAAARKRPLDRFFPEALGRVQLALGDDAAAFASLKKAYYMSGENDELLAELRDLSGRLGDLDSAIYYSRQTISRGQGQSNLESWEKLIGMLEKDFRSREAELVRRRLEIKFGQDPEFLERTAEYYRENGRLSDALRILKKRKRLLEWDPGAQFDLALLLADLGKTDQARPLFESVLHDTESEPLPAWAGTGLWPLTNATQDEKKRLDALNFELQTFPDVSIPVEDQVSQWILQRTHPEFSRRPAQKYPLRLRALEETGKCLANAPDKENWIADFLKSDRPPHEKWWIVHHARSAAGAAELFSEFDSRFASPIATFAVTNTLLHAREIDSLLRWAHAETGEDDHVFAPEQAVLFAAYHQWKQGGNLSPDVVAPFLAEFPPPHSAASYVFSQLTKNHQFRIADQFGKLAGADGDLYFSRAALSRWLGNRRSESDLLDEGLSGVKLTPESRLPVVAQLAVADRYHAWRSPEERESFSREFQHRLASHDRFSSLTNIQLNALFSILDQDYDAAFQSLSGIVDEILAIKPQYHILDSQFVPYLTGWRLADSDFRFYSDLIPRKHRRSNRFTDAFSTKKIAGDEGKESRQVRDSREQFEIIRIAERLHGKNAWERAQVIDESLAFFHGQDGRLDLARQLEISGRHREAALVYYREVLRGSEDYAPLLGFFKCCNRALEPLRALEVIEKLRNKELPWPPGLTAEYVNQQHARFLFHQRDLETLRRLSQPPVVGEDREVVLTNSHMPYLRELQNAYRQIGDTEALLDLLTDRRSRGDVGIKELLAGAHILTDQQNYAEALEWLDEISFNRDDIARERDAVKAYARIFSEDPDSTSREQVKWLARLALHYPSYSLTSEVTSLFQQRGELREALALLRAYRRLEKRDRFRSAAQLDIIRLLDSDPSSNPEEKFSEVDVFFHRLRADDVDLQFAFAENLAKRDHDGAEADWIAQFAEHPRAQLLCPLIRGFLKGQLPEETSRLMTESSSSAQSEDALYLLTALGEEGRNLAQEWVSRSSKSGPEFFPGNPARQIRFFSSIADRTRLMECHAALMNLADSYFFSQMGMEQEYSGLMRHWEMPALLDSLGHSELAESLYRKFYDNIRHFREGLLPFLEAYFDFLLKENETAQGEKAARELLSYSHGFDLRKLVLLYHQKEGDGGFFGNGLAEELSEGQKNLVEEWRRALVEGREMVQYRAR